MAIHDGKTMNVMKDIAIFIPASTKTKSILIKILPENSTSSSSGNNEAIENVLILQGGGSLGAFGCGVFKALSQKEVKIDIVAGTSIGGVNAAIIAGSKNEKQPEQLLEQFWLELANNYTKLNQKERWKNIRNRSYKVLLKLGDVYNDKVS